MQTSETVTYGAAKMGGLRTKGKLRKKQKPSLASHVTQLRARGAFKKGR